MSVNVAGMLIAKRLEFRGTVLAGAGLAALGALGFATFDASTPDWQSLLFMGLMGLGIGPALSGLQIALQRSVRPAADRRRDGHAPAPAPGRRRGRAGERGDRLPRGRTIPAVATGMGVLTIGLVGSLIAAAALISLPRAAGRLPAPPAMATA